MEKRYKALGHSRVRYKVVFRAHSEFRIRSKLQIYKDANMEQKNQEKKLNYN